MEGIEKVAEKVPGWVERLLIPTLETRVKAIVKEEVGHLEKTMNSKFEAVNTRFDSFEQSVNARFDAVNRRFDAVDARFEAVNTRFDSVERRIESLDKSINVEQDITDLKVRMAAVERRTAG